MQCGHVLSVLAAGSPDVDWARTTLVAHTAPASELVRLIEASGGHPAVASADTAGLPVGVAWFVEPDLLYAPTAFAVTPHAPEELLAEIAELPLYDPAPTEVAPVVPP